MYIQEVLNNDNVHQLMMNNDQIVQSVLDVYLPYIVEMNSLDINSNLDLLIFENDGLNDIHDRISRDISNDLCYFLECVSEIVSDDTISYSDKIDILFNIDEGAISAGRQKRLDNVNLVNQYRQGNITNSQIGTVKAANRNNTGPANIQHSLNPSSTVNKFGAGAVHDAAAAKYAQIQKSIANKSNSRSRGGAINLSNASPEKIKAQEDNLLRQRAAITTNNLKSNINSTQTGITQPTPAVSNPVTVAQNIANTAVPTSAASPNTGGYAPRYTLGQHIVRQGFALGNWLKQKAGNLKNWANTPQPQNQPGYVAPTNTPQQRSNMFRNFSNYLSQPVGS
jgi:hypothetical protein